MERLVVWKLDNLLTLEKITELLKLNYDKDIEFINELVEAGEITLDRKEDAIYNNLWYANSNKEDFEISLVEFGEYSIRYISANGSFEYGFGKQRAFIDGHLMNRNKRVFRKECSAIFFEFENEVYLALQTLESNESDIRGSLLGQGRKNKNSEWGKISKVAYPFTFESAFFYWLLTKKGKEVQFKKQSISIIDVNAISVLSEGSTYNNTSEGNALLDVCLPALSVLSINEMITNIGLKLKLSDYEIVINFNKNAVVQIDTVKSHKLIDDEENISTYSEDSNGFILLIYAYIFPALLELFEKDKSGDNWKGTVKMWQRNWAIDVVKVLIRHNDIKTSDLDSDLPNETEKIG